MWLLRLLTGRWRITLIEVALPLEGAAPEPGLIAETWLELSPRGRLLAVGVSRYEQLAVIQRIRRGDGIYFASAERPTSGASRMAPTDFIPLADASGQMGAWPP